FPLPVTVDSVLMVIHATSLAAFHVHPAIVVTETVCDPPAGPTVAFDRSSENWQTTPSWRMTMRCQCTTTTPGRGRGSAFDATAELSRASPWPVAPEVIEIQFASADADQAHSRSVVTLAVPVPPLALNCVVEVSADSAHLSGDGSVVVDEDEPHAVAASTAT